MSFRITNNQSTQFFIDQINRQKVGLEESRQMLSSGVEVSTPGDAPSKAATIENYNRTIVRLDAYKDRINSGISSMELQETVLNTAESIMLRGKELATQAANETLSSEQREQMAIEVFELRDSLVSLGNTKNQGVYIYGGFDDDDPPFDDTPASGVAGTPGYTNSLGAGTPSSQRFIYDGEDGTANSRDIVVSDFESVRITTPGDQVFQGGISALERLGRALSGFYTTPASSAATPDGGGLAMTFPADYHLQTQEILNTMDAFDTSLSKDITGELMSVGARLNKLHDAFDIADSLVFNIKNARSGVQDVDMFEAAANFSNLQTSLEALLNAGVQMNSLSILNYI
ncbi:MAG: flagellar hook-associated protein FlgL [bacterium]|nr:flagellar hook-associated protein FlgL [bacterium]